MRPTRRYEMSRSGLSPVAYPAWSPGTARWRSCGTSPIPRLLLAFAFMCPLADANAAPVLLDRIAVTVGSDVITESQVIEEIRVTAFLNGQKLDFGAMARRQAAERLVDQALIRRDMKLGNFPEPELSETDKLLAEIKQQRFADDAEYHVALQRCGIDEQVLKAHLLWQLAALRYTNYRFRPSIPTASQALHQHLEQNAQQRSAQEAQGRPPGDEAGNKAESSAAAPPSLEQQLNAWLKDARARTHIRFREEAFE